MKGEQVLPDTDTRKAVDVSLPPPNRVLQKFGALGHPEWLDGGQGQTYRAGAVVLKPVNQCDGWISELQASIANDRFPMPRPLKCDDGGWLCDGWAAWEFVNGRDEPGRWQEKIQTCVDFHNAISTIPKPLELNTASNPWSVADRVAWDERELIHHPRVEPSIDRLKSVLRPLGGQNQLIHGDFQMLFAIDGTNVVIDFAPYWRPATFAAAVVVVDALVWGTADTAIVDLVRHMPDYDQYLARAELRRIVEIEVLTSDYGWNMLDEIETHFPTIGLICDLCR